MDRLSDLALMQLHVETLFLCDKDARLLFINEPLHPELHPAPLVFIGRSAGDCVCCCRHDVPAALCDEFEQIARQQAGNRRDGDSAMVDKLVQVAEQSGLEVGRVWSGPAYHFANLPPAGAGCTVLNSSHTGLLRTYFDDIIPELGAVDPCVAIVDAGNAVSICRTVRRSLRAVEAGVNTAVAYRGRGLATQVVAKWASLVSESGLAPMYSTSWDNVASRSLASRLGLVQYGIDISLSE